ncbi:MAG: alpha/beta fold hydrolase [Burkholderiales bacterium]|nr:alpha/beta fold hydrolase [Burkholderiales bacterium]
MPHRNFQSIRTNGIQLRCVVEGDGPLAIMVHGWPESWYSWRHQIDPVCRAGYRVVVPDVRGYGQSDAPESVDAYDMENIIGDVLGLIDHFEEKQAILIGHDWGAAIVWNTTALNPERVRAVAAMSVPYAPRGKISPSELWKQLYPNRFFYQLYFQKPGVAEAEFEADVRTSLRKLYYSGSGDAPDGIFRADKLPSDCMLSGMPDPEVLPAWLTQEDLDYYTRQFEDSGFRGSLNRYRNQDRDWQNLTALGGARITRPTCFIAGSRDAVLRFVPGVDLVENMKRWVDDLRTCVIIDGAGHWIQQERPQQVNAALLEFLATLDTRLQPQALMTEKNK